MKDMTKDMGRNKIWTCLYEQGNVCRDSQLERLVIELGIHPVTARLLINRGLNDPQAAKRFLENDISIWHDPYTMKDMEKGVERILRAVEADEKIVVYGDYDVDGVTSVSSLYIYLKELGAQVSCYIPSRSLEGYGMSKGALKQLRGDGVSLVITVDTGITANEEVAYASSIGMDVVVTDHHECHGELPLCCAVINPHRPDCDYPFKELAGVGVVFKLVCACEIKRSGESDSCKILPRVARLLDLVAIGTVADVMPIVDENRYIVSQGLAMLETTERCGLAALLSAISGSGSVKTAGKGDKKVSRSHRRINTGLIGYGVAPRINAAGRIAHAMRAVELLLADNTADAERLAQELCEINTQRQAEENRIAEQAYKMIDTEMEKYSAREGETGHSKPRVIVLADDGWMQGIIGIVSSRITERYGLPSILISFDGAITGEPNDADIGKGSGRSVKGMNLVDALTYCENLLVRFGGHELAAGLSVRRGDVDAFRKRICEYAEKYLTDDMTAVRYEAECELNNRDVTMELAEEIERLEPFGAANQTPVFILSDLTVHRIISMGNGKHTKLMLAKNGNIHQAVWFGMPTARFPFAVGDSVDILFQLNINEYQNVRTLQLILQDVRQSVASRDVCAKEQIRYGQIIEGAKIYESENVIPSRDDIARVYTLLRHDARMGINTFSNRDLMAKVNFLDNTNHIGYIKMKFILQILDELRVCNISEPGADIYVVEIDFDAPKTNIESSALLRRLRSQLCDASQK